MKHTPTIQHYSRLDVAAGLVRKVDPKKTVLIQIKTPEDCYVVPTQKFSEIHQFDFHDFSYDVGIFQVISDEQAKKIADILLKAYNDGKDVVVHCDAGISRSSAVALCGKDIGFSLSDAKYRNPNSLVYLRISKHLPILNFDPEKSAFIGD